MKELNVNRPPNLAATEGAPSRTTPSPATPAELATLTPGMFSSLGRDIPAGIVVFLVALPLCLGIAVASGAPPFSGLIAGILGGIVVPLISGSALSVSGPAAGLAAVVLTGIATVGSFEVFLLAVVLAGILQIAMGAARAGIITFFVPSSVIKGLLTAIGVLLIKKQIPVALGATDLSSVLVGAVIVSGVSIAVMIVFEQVSALKKLYFLPSALVVVVVGTGMNVMFASTAPTWTLHGTQLVQLPALAGFDDLRSALTSPQWSALGRGDVWLLAVTLAIVASLETLLNLGAVDRLDPSARISPPNRELVAQGIANMLSGLAGGLPITSVIIRGSANVNAGAKTKMSAFVHGVCLLLAVAFGATLLSHIPLACLAAILLMTGYKLAKPAVFIGMYRAGVHQFMPFITTVVAIVGLDLLKGVMVGLLVGLGFVIHESMRYAFTVKKTDAVWYVVLEKDTFFFTRAALQRLLDEVPPHVDIVLDAEHARYIDPDVMEMLTEFRLAALERGRLVDVKGLALSHLQPTTAS